MDDGSNILLDGRSKLMLDRKVPRRVRLEEGAAKAEAEEAAKDAAEADSRDRIDYPSSPKSGRSSSRSRPPTTPTTGDRVSDVLSSPVAKDLMRTAAREILRGVFKVGRR